MKLNLRHAGVIDLVSLLIDFQALEAKVLFLTKEKMQVESDLQDLLSQKEELDVSLQLAKSETKEQRSNYDDLLSKFRSMNSIFMCIKMMHNRLMKLVMIR